MNLNPQTNRAILREGAGRSWHRSFAGPFLMGLRQFRLLFLCCLLLACGQGGESPVNTGGFGSETTNGIEVSGKTEPGLVLTARRLDGSGTTLAIQSDSVTGAWVVSLAAGEWMIVGQSGDNAFARFLALVGKDSTFSVGSLFTQPRATVFGRVVSPSAGMRVVVEGIDRSVDVESDGTFGMDRIAQGTYMVDLVKDGRILQRRLYETGSTLVFDPSDPSLLLGNFDDDWGESPLSPLLSGGWIVRGDDNLLDSAGNVPGLWADEWMVESGALGGQGKSVHLKLKWGMDADTTQRTEYAYDFGGRWGTTITSLGDELYPVFQSDSLVFWAKGDVSLTVRVGLTPRPWDGSDLRDAILVVPLTGQWKRYALAWSEFALDGTRLGSGFRQHLVGDIRFAVGAGDFWLDQVAITPASPGLFLGH